MIVIASRISKMGLSNYYDITTFESSGSQSVQDDPFSSF